MSFGLKPFPQKYHVMLSGILRISMLNHVNIILFY